MQEPPGNYQGVPIKMGSQPLPTDSLGILDRAQYIKTDAALAQEPPGVAWGRGRSLS